MNMKLLHILFVWECFVICVCIFCCVLFVCYHNCFSVVDVGGVGVDSGGAYHPGMDTSYAAVRNCGNDAIDFFGHV